MNYNIKDLSKLSGISTRTLRYYDEIGLLSPNRNDNNDYRVYSQHDVDCLQQILFFRELGFPLNEIKTIINSKNYDNKKILSKHLLSLEKKKKQLNTLINNVKTTILFLNGDVTMTNEEKFEGFKKEIIAENEQRYGKEIRHKYGNEAIDNYNSNIMKMSKKDYAYSKELEDEILDVLSKAVSNKENNEEEAKLVSFLHKKWIIMFWGEQSYTPEAHRALAKSYIEDERFKQYYDNAADGAAQFLQQAIEKYI